MIIGANRMMSNTTQKISVGLVMGRYRSKFGILCAKVVQIVRNTKKKKVFSFLFSRIVRTFDDEIGKCYEDSDNRRWCSGVLLGCEPEGDDARDGGDHL
jgi:hypothetical protein